MSIRYDVTVATKTSTKVYLSVSLADAHDQLLILIIQYAWVKDNCRLG
ncbi:hypothetical protein JYQ62_16525 [Nostoc sp. UHCC 0702]|nr:hypothetical protein JYQ62_16525 [Nostoc sp. UHCC 0702]